MTDTLAVDCPGTIAGLHPRGFGFICYSLAASKVERPVRIYFHLADSDGTDFKIGDRVLFDAGFDFQNRPRAYNVRLAAPLSVVDRG